LYKNQGKYDEAAEMLAVSAQDNKYDSGSHLALGDTYYAANNLDIAIKHYVEAVKLIDLKTVNSHRAQQLVQYYASLADKYIANGDNDKIMSFIRTVGSFFAKSSWQEKVIEARQRMDSVAEDGNVMSLAEFLEAPETEVVVTTLAVTKEYIRRNLLMTASEECLRAIQKAPSFLRLHLLLAEILLRQDQTDQAITKYLYIAKVYQMRKQPDKAVEVFEKILRLAPMDVTVRSKLIDLHTSLEHFEQALDQYLVLADAYYQLAQVDRALEKYNEALRLTSTIGDPDTWKAKILSQMGDIYNQRFDWARATTAYEELIGVNPHDEHTQRQLVDLYFKQGKTDQAIVALDKLLTTYQQQDASSKPVELLKELVSGHPENMPLRERLAVAYAQSGMKREAIAEYDALGEMQLESGLRDQATQTIQKILTLGPDDAEGYRRLLSKISGGVT
jgi:tetratricopeptide (TPR) repeat protein